MAEMFGWEILRKNQKEKFDSNATVSFAPEKNDDGTVVVNEGGVYGTFVDLDGSVRSEGELVNKYREMSEFPEIDQAITEIVNEAIVDDGLKEVVTLNLDKLKQPESIKKRIQEEFNSVLQLMEFNSHSYEIFRKWYIDGRMYYHCIIDDKNPRAGILELRYVDPRKIRKIRQTRKKKIKDSNVIGIQTTAEYYIYSDRGFAKSTTNSYTYQDAGSVGVKIAADAIAYTASGLMNVSGDLVLGYLNKSLKPLNQLRAMEDSLVIYRISRAPERRIFYIDVGNLPKVKAEQYLRDVMTRFKNKLVYDSSTGEVKDDRKFMTMLEDFWLPRREGGKGTEITTLPGGQNLGQIEDIEYFQKKLYNSLNVPLGRLSPDQQFTLGRSSQVSRDEVKFSKFINRLRSRFSDIFNKILEKQLVLKGIIVTDDWKEFSSVFRYEYAEDNYFSELKESEIVNDRLAALNNVMPFIGRFYSNQFVRRNILHQSSNDIEDIDKQIKEERDVAQYQSAQAQSQIDMSMAGRPEEPQDANTNQADVGPDK